MTRPPDNANPRNRPFIVHPNGVVEVTDVDRYTFGILLQCNTCSRVWDDDVVTGITPAPSGRCPFEYDHPDEDDSPAARLEYLRGELRAERISYGELAELQGLVEHIDPGDAELLEAAGVPEAQECPHDFVSRPEWAPGDGWAVLLTCELCDAQTTIDLGDITTQEWE